MTLEEIRVEALKIAAATTPPPTTPDRIIRIAGQYEAYIIGEV